MKPQNVRGNPTCDSDNRIPDNDEKLGYFTTHVIVGFAEVRMHYKWIIHASLYAIPSKQRYFIAKLKNRPCAIENRVFLICPWSLGV